jgi:hypothetical protein
MLPEAEQPNVLKRFAVSCLLPFANMIDSWESSVAVVKDML